MAPVDTEILAEAVAGRVMAAMAPHLAKLNEVQLKVQALETKAEALEDREARSFTSWDYIKGNTLSTVTATLFAAGIILLAQHIWK